jgi:hypothetical protein
MLLVLAALLAVNTATSPTFSAAQFALALDVQVSVTAGPGCAVTVAAAVDTLLPADAVTDVSTLVVSWTLASPFASVTPVVLLNVPRLAENVTATPDTGRPPVANTEAITSTVPPLADTTDGLVRTVTESTAAAPMVI